MNARTATRPRTTTQPRLPFDLHIATCHLATAIWQARLQAHESGRHDLAVVFREMGERLDQVAPA